MPKADNHGSKAAPITIDGDEPVVKREAEEEADSPSVADLKMKLEKTERLAQDAINQAGTYLARVEFLEGLVDEKNDFIKKKQTSEDLEKKLEVLSDQLEKEKKIREEGEENHKKKVEDLSNQLEKEKKTREEGEEIHKKKEAELLQSFNTMDEANKMMEKLLDESEKDNKELRRRFIEIEKLKEQHALAMDGEERDDREEAEKGAISQAGTYRARVLFLEDEKNEFIKKKQKSEDLEKKIEELSSKLAEYEEGSQSIQQLQQKAAQAEKKEEELKKRVLDLMNQVKEESRRLNEERKRGLEDRMRDQERFEALTAKLEELEQQLSVLQVKQQEKENIPEQLEELQHNEDARNEVEGEASLEKGQNEDKKLDDAKDAKKADEPEKSVNDMCQEVAGIINNNEQWRHVMKIIHQMFLKNEKETIKEMLECGIVPFLVGGLSIHDEEIQLHCATAIAKIVKLRREKNRKVVESGAVAPLIALITSTNYELAEMATKAVSGISIDSAELRDVVIQSKVVEVLTTICGKLEDLPVSFVRVIAEAFSDMCRHMYSQKSLEVLDVIVQCLFRLLQFEDNEVCKSVIGALVKITSYELGSKVFPQKMLVRNSGILPFVFKHLKDDDDDLVLNALQVLTKIAYGSESLKQSVLDLGTLSVLPGIMQKKAKNSMIITTCCILIKNVTYGNKAKLQSVINNGLLKMINKGMLTGNSDCQYHCSWALHHLTQFGTREQILSLLAEKPMPALAAVLTHADSFCIYTALSVIYILLVFVSSSQLDTLKKEAEEAGVLDNLVKLKKHSNEEVRSLANKIFSECFAEKYGKEANENLKEKEDEEETKMVQKRKRVSDDANSNGVKKGKSDEKEMD